MAGLKLISYPSGSLMVIRPIPLPVKKLSRKKEKILKPKNINLSRSVIQSHATNTVRFNEHTLYL